MGIEKLFLLNLPDEWLGERVALRRWRDEDARALYEAILASNEYIAQWLPWPLFYHSVDDARQFIRGNSGHWSIHKHIGTGIWRQEDGALLGSIGVTVRDWALPSFELGYWIGQMHTRKGYVSESLRVMTHFLFEQLRAQRVAIRCDARNERSKHVPERLGFVFEGCVRHDTIGTDGTIRDTLIYAMIPVDFQHTHAAWSAQTRQ